MTGLPHKILTQGGGHGAVDCNGLNPSNQIIPGGFAWLDAGRQHRLRGHG